MFLTFMRWKAAHQLPQSHVWWPYILALTGIKDPNHVESVPIKTIWKQTPEVGLMYLHELLKGLIQNLLDQSGDVCVNAQSSDVFGFWIGPLKLRQYVWKQRLKLFFAKAGKQYLVFKKTTTAVVFVEMIKKHTVTFPSSWHHAVIKWVQQQWK